MSDFFGALELELHAAAERRPRRPVSVGQVLGALAGTALVAMAAAVVVAVSSGGDGGGESGQVTGGRAPDPVGTVIPKSETHYETRALVVANGTAPVSGRWQIEVSRTKGERATDGTLMWGKGYCMWLNVLDPPDESGGRSGHCGSPRSLGFRKTPGFSRGQGMTTSRPPAKEVLVWGRVPDRAARVVITAPGRRRIAIVPEEGPKTFPGRFYVIPVKPPRPGARINWLDASGRPGSRGIGLMPPIAR